MTQTIQDNENPSGETPSAKPVVAPVGAPGNSRRKKIIRWGSAGLIILSVAFGIRYYLHALSHESTDDAFIDGNIVSISPRVAGHVAGVQARDNQLVNAGELLVELDPHDFEARLDAATAVLEAAAP
jgi:membrane fusion protein, multidrug efflux system